MCVCVVGWSGGLCTAPLPCSADKQSLLTHTVHHHHLHTHTRSPNRQVAEGIAALIKVLAKSMDSSLSVDKVEVATITRDEATGKVSTWVERGGHASS